MSTTSLGTGTVVLRLAAPTPSVALLEVHDACGRLVLRRRVRDPRVALSLPRGWLRLSVTDERRLVDPRRLAGSSVVVDVDRHAVLETTLALVPGAVVRVTSAPWAVIGARHPDGSRHEARADGHGNAVLGGLDSGPWTLGAVDRRGSRCSEPVVVALGAGDHTAVTLQPSQRTARLLVRVRGTDRRPVLATEVVAVDTAGRRVVAPLRDGLADLRDLRPGPHVLLVDPSVGHLGAESVVSDLTGGTMAAAEVVVPIGAGVSGRVVQGNHQYAAVVTLLDEEGEVLETVRTGKDGRFVLGRGLTARHGLTVVATTGPETLHVTRAAVADVDVLTGVRHDLGDIALPVAGRPATWASRRGSFTTRTMPAPRV